MENARTAEEKYMIKIYTSSICPKCNIIKTKMKSKGIEYEEINDELIMEQKGFVFLPVLEVDNEIISSFTEINNYINNR